MPDTTDEILQWAESQPLWQRDALRRIFTTGLLESDLQTLADICKAAYGLGLPPQSEPIAAAHLKSHIASGAKPITLKSLTHHHGVNALASEQTISFGPCLTVVYGNNAAGKSGYTRILKQACRARNVEKILGNVLTEGAPAKAHSTLVFSDGDQSESVAWNSEATAHPKLSQISVFDSKCVPVYLGEANDVAFRPFDLDVFDTLASTCAAVRRILESEQAALTTVLSLPPDVASGTKVYGLLTSITALTKEEAVKALGSLSSENEERLTHLQALKRDLLAADPAKRAQELIAQAKRFESLASHLRTLFETLGPESFEQLQGLWGDVQSAMQAVDQLFRTTFTSDLITNTGGVEWRSLWQAAEAFLKAPGGPGVEDWAAHGAKCPLCQQSLERDGVERLEHLRGYINSAAQENLRLADKAWSANLSAVNALSPDRADIMSIVAELTLENAPLSLRVTAYLDNAIAIKKRVVQWNQTADPADVTLESDLESEVQKMAVALRARAKELQAAATSLSVDQQSELNELEARVVLRTRVPDVLREIERRREVDAYRNAITETNTLAITTKSSELTKRLVTQQLTDTFKAEVAALEFKHLSVEVQPAGASKGQLFHHIVFSNAPKVSVVGVLSEGESRTLSLAAFA